MQSVIKYVQYNSILIDIFFCGCEGLASIINDLRAAICDYPNTIDGIHSEYPKLIIDLCPNDQDIVFSWRFRYESP